MLINFFVNHTNITSYDSSCPSNFVVLQMFAFLYLREAISQNHRTVEVGRHLRRSSRPTRLLKQGQPGQIAISQYFLFLFCLYKADETQLILGKWRVLCMSKCKWHWNNSVSSCICQLQAKDCVWPGLKKNSYQEKSSMASGNHHFPKRLKVPQELRRISKKH